MGVIEQSHSVKTVLMCGTGTKSKYNGMEALATAPVILDAGNGYWVMVKVESEAYYLKWRPWAMIPPLVSPPASFQCETGVRLPEERSYLNK